LIVLANSWLSLLDTHSMFVPPVPVSACCTRHAVTRTQSAQPAILLILLLPPSPCLLPWNALNSQPGMVWEVVAPIGTLLIPSDRLPLSRIMPGVSARRDDASPTPLSSACEPCPLPMAALGPGPSHARLRNREGIFKAGKSADQVKWARLTDTDHPKGNLRLHG